MAKTAKKTTTKKTANNTWYTLGLLDTTGELDCLDNEFWPSPGKLLEAIDNDQADADEGEPIVEIKIVGYVRKGRTAMEKV